MQTPPKEPLQLSEIRTFLFRYAEQKKWRIKEFISTEPGLPSAFYCHVEIPGKAGEFSRSATSVSHEGADSALAKAFLYLGNPALDFLTD